MYPKRVIVTFQFNSTNLSVLIWYFIPNICCILDKSWSIDFFVEKIHHFFMTSVFKSVRF